jgi:hypothetical protein
MAITGIIKNSLKNDIFVIYAEALAFDKSGKLICGGGGIPIGFVPGNGQAAVEVRLETMETPARVDLIPRLESYGLLEPPSDEMKDIHIAGLGVRLGSANSAEYTAIFENTSKKVYMALDYRFAVYAEDGSVIAVGTGEAYTLFPHDRIAVLGSMYLPPDARVARADVQFNYYEGADQTYGDDRALKLTANPLSASPDVTVTEDEFYYSFTGSISNNLLQDIQGAEVVGVAYDDQGKIIGSNRAYVDVPARGSAEVQLSLMKTPARPARVVLFPALPGNWGTN